MARSDNSPPKGVNWANVFDLVASEYGYTWDQFTGLTYIQLHAFLEAINRRTHNNTAVQAAMHGIKVDLYKKIDPPAAENLQQIDDEITKIFKEKASANGKR